MFKGPGFTIVAGRVGKRMELRGAWNREFAEQMRLAGVQELEINYAKGFVGKDISFLADLDWLEGLLLIHRTLPDDTAVQSLSSLRLLDLNTYCRNPINFSAFPRLEECSLEWRSGAASLFQCHTISRLFINSYTAKHSESFRSLHGLTELRIANGALSDLSGLSSCRNLDFLGLYNLKRLPNLQGLGELAGLERLELNGCRNIRNIDEIAKLRHLRVLHLCDDGHISSLKPLADLVELEEFLFYESTNILDGDLSPLIQLPSLKKVVFAERVHYSHRRLDFERSVLRK